VAYKSKTVRTFYVFSKSKNVTFYVFLALVLAWTTGVGYLYFYLTLKQSTARCEILCYAMSN